MARWQQHSTEFCGITLVRWGSRPRRAVKVYRGYYLVALCPNGKAAVEMDSAFEPPTNRRPIYLNRRLAQDLHAIGAISDAALKSHTELCNDSDKRKLQREASDQLESGAETLGLTLTAAQRAVVKAAAVAA